MTLSMTAFARTDQETPWGTLVWELRSVNHRYLELGLRLPEELRHLETPVREILGKRVGRGKLDVTLRYQARETADTGMTLDQGQVDRLLGAARRVEAMAAERDAVVSPWRIVDLLRWPGVLVAPKIDVDALSASAVRLLDVAVEQLIDTRRREGARLGETLKQRLETMSHIAERVRQLLPEVAQLFRSKLEARLAEVRGELDPARLEQEMLLFAQKMDVTEELERLSVHIDEVRRVLGQSGQIGRRLDFLMQELHREANTLGSKSPDVRLTNAAVDLKVLIEQMREQVQNIE